MLDFEGSESDFVITMKKETTLVIGQFIDDHEDGFIDDLNDMLEFLKDNAKALIKSFSEPKNVKMAEIMSIPVIM